MTAPAPPARPEHARRIAGYEILSKIGQGGMGAVYKARQVSLDRLVALKVLPKQLTDNPDFIGRFEREARLTGQLNHPHIIKVFDVGRSVTGIWYYAMEFVDGESLRAIQAREGKLPPERVLRMVEQVAEALDHAHRHGIIHRDVKPDNVLIDREGSAKLADLGLAKASGDAPLMSLGARGAQGSFASLSGAVVGTPYYMSPEQAEGKAVDTRSDLYALGATAYHLLAGRPPFEADTPMGVITKHLTEPAPPLTGTPEALARIVARLLEKDAAKRHQTPAELLAALAEARNALPLAPPPASPPAPRRRAWMLAAGAAVLLGIMAAVASAVRYRAGPSGPVSGPAPNSEAEAGARLEEANACADPAGRRRLLASLLAAFPDTRAGGVARGLLKDLGGRFPPADPGKQPVPAPLPVTPEPVPPSRAPVALSPTTPAPAVPVPVPLSPAAPVPDPRVAQRKEAVQRLGEVDALVRARAWPRAQLESEALRLAFDPLGQVLDPASLNRLGKLESRIQENVRNHAFRHAFDEAREAEAWAAADAASGLQGKAERPRKGTVGVLMAGAGALRIGAEELGKPGSCAEARGPRFSLTPEARLVIRGRVLARYGQTSRPALFDCAYLCLRGRDGAPIVPKSLRTPSLFLTERLAPRKAADAPGAHREIPLAAALPIGRIFLGLRAPPVEDVQLCAGITLEESKDRSAQLILDEVEVYYGEDKP